MEFKFSIPFDYKSAFEDTLTFEGWPQKFLLLFLRSPPILHLSTIDSKINLSYLNSKVTIWWATFRLDPNTTYQFLFCMPPRFAPHKLAHNLELRDNLIFLVFVLVGLKMPLLIIQDCLDHSSINASF